MTRHYLSPSAGEPSGPLKHQSGVSLIEALVAMAVMLGGMAAILGFHANVTGNSAQNRLAAAAMSAAQSKLEQLRNRPFNELADGSDPNPYRIINPGIGGAFEVKLDRCWSFTPLSAVSDSLAAATVAVVREGEACVPNGPALASLTTFIAEADPRIAARNVDIQRRADGDARLVEGYTPPEGEHPSLPGGFQLIKEDGALVAIFNPNTGQALLPKDSDDPLKYAEINGNIIFKGSRDADDIENLTIKAEGAATCRLFYPGSEGASPAVPSVSGGGKTVSYVQYSCIVADGWRRAIYLLPAPGESACVGHPNLQHDGDETDILAANARQYYGYAWKTDEDGTKKKIEAGIRGSVDGASFTAVIGSVCVEGQSCWKDAELRGWVPGGHHFFVKKDGDGSCADSMGILSEIDEAMTSPPSLYANILYRNPHKVYCTNTKSYTNDLPDIDTSAGEATSEDCYSTTKLSGFMVNSDKVSVKGSEIRLGSSSRFYTGGCRAIGRFGTGGGAYVCGYGEEVPDVRFTPYARDKNFNPITVSGLSPLDFPHDIVLRSFAFTASDAGVGDEGGTDTDGDEGGTDTDGDEGSGSGTGTTDDTEGPTCTSTTKSESSSSMAKQYSYTSCRFTTGSGSCTCSSKVESDNNVTYTCDATFVGANATVIYQFTRKSKNHSDFEDVKTFTCP